MFMRRKEPPGSPSHHVALESAVGFLHHILSIHRTTEHAVGDGKEVGTIGFKGFHSVSSYVSTHENRWCSLWAKSLNEDVRHFCRGGRLRYFLSNTNSGWLTAARSNSSLE